jgi:two-component sensor histidine kinase
MLLRLQRSATRNLRAEDVLNETINRILSIAAVHETMSEQGLRVVDVKDVLQRVCRTIGETMLATGQGITITVSGDRLVLPSREATSLTLATSELVQNALKHAFVGCENGQIRVNLQAGSGDCTVVVEDDGVGDARRQSKTKGIGLQIVETLVREDLKGRFDRSASSKGTHATIQVPISAGVGAKS